MLRPAKLGSNGNGIPKHFKRRQNQNDPIKPIKSTNKILPYAGCGRNNLKQATNAFQKMLSAKHVEGKGIFNCLLVNKRRNINIGSHK